MGSFRKILENVFRPSRRKDSPALFALHALFVLDLPGSVGRHPVVMRVGTADVLETREQSQGTPSSSVTSLSHWVTQTATPQTPRRMRVTITVTVAE